VHDQSAVKAGDVLNLSGLIFLRHSQQDDPRKASAREGGCAGIDFPKLRSTKLMKQG
jgi:hypothetical protein